MSSITLCERIDTSLQLALLPSFEGFEFGWGIFLAAVFYTLHKTYAASKIGSQTIVFTLLLIVYLPLVVVSKSFYFGSEIHDMMMNQKFCFLMSTVEDSVPW